MIRPEEDKIKAINRFFETVSDEKLDKMIEEVDAQFTPKMPLNELRLGLIVLNSNKEIVKITPNQLILALEGVVVFTPIELSEDWLKRFKGDFKVEDGLIVIRVIGMFPDGARHTRFLMFSFEEVKYVHRFQNLYFSLKDSELTLSE